MKLPRYTRPLTYDERHAHDGLGNAPEFLEEHHARALDKGISRAGGDAVCESCGHVYYDHPSVVGALWVTELCSGRLVKL